MMKKTALVTALALLGVVGAASVNAAPQTPAPQQMATDFVSVQFEGKVAATTCNVTVGVGSNTVKLGQVSPEAKSKGALMPITFGFSGCKAAKTVKNIKFEGGQNGAGDANSRGVLGTNNKNVFVQLFNNKDNLNATFNPTVDVNQRVTEGDQGKLSVTPFHARLEVGGYPAEAGTITSNALFTVSYQ